MKTVTINYRNCLLRVREDGRIEKPTSGGSKLISQYLIKGYPAISVKAGGKWKTFHVHRIVASAFISPDDKTMQIDHIDGNKENNHFTNLRWVTSTQNNRAFRSVSKNASSRFRGVSWDQRKQKWISYVYTNGKSYFLGAFAREEDAAQAYNEKALHFNFDKSALNVIK